MAGRPYIDIVGSAKHNDNTSSHNSEKTIMAFLREEDRNARKEYASLKNPNPKKEETSPEFRKVNTNLDKAKKTSLEYLGIKALEVQRDIEKHQWPKQKERWIMSVHGGNDEIFALTSFGSTTNFRYIKGEQGDIFFIEAPSWYQKDAPPIVTNDVKELMHIVNFLNFGRNYIRNNKDNFRSIKWEGMAPGPFYEDGGAIKCAIKYFTHWPNARPTLGSIRLLAFDATLQKNIHPLILHLNTMQAMERNGEYHY